MIGELELAARFLKGKILAITGSNGKTTTTALLGEILTAAGLPTLVGGNIGVPVVGLIDESTAETWSVLEVSSFQLESTLEFHPTIAVILNITPDHLDRHGSFENYARPRSASLPRRTQSDFAGAERRQSARRPGRGASGRQGLLVFHRAPGPAGRLVGEWLRRLPRRQGRGRSNRSCRSEEFRSRARTTSRMCWPRSLRLAWPACRLMRFAAPSRSFRPSSTASSTSPPSTASSTTTTPKPPTSMPRPRPSPPSPPAFTSSSAAKTKTLTTPSSRLCCANASAPSTPSAPPLPKSSRTSAALSPSTPAKPSTRPSTPPPAPRARARSCCSPRLLQL